MPTILVTGGAGFIGSHIVDLLIEKSHSVVVFDDLSGGSLANVNPKAIFVQGSICDTDLVNQLFSKHKFEFVFHMAAYAAEGLSHFVRKFNYQNNIIGSSNLINASVNYNIRCFVFASSIAVYGKNQLPFREENTPIPIDPYGIAKYAVELDLQSAKELFGLNHIIFRAHNVYGERQNLHDPYRNVIGIFMNQALNNQPLTIFGDGKQTRAFTHISDVAPHIVNSIEIERALNQTFNIGTTHTYTVNDIAQKVKDLMGSESPIKYLAGRNEARHAHSEHHKLRTICHIKTGTALPLDQGLERMANWAKQNHSQKPTFKPNIEVQKNLPENWKN